MNSQRVPLHIILEQVDPAQDVRSRRPFSLVPQEVDLIQKTKDEMREEFSKRMGDVFGERALDSTHLLANAENELRSQMSDTEAEDEIDNILARDGRLKAAVAKEDKIVQLKEQLDLDPKGTGAITQRAFLERVALLQEGERKKQEREGRRESDNTEPFAFIMVDGDKFKSVNDTYGHRAGDMVLNELVRRMKSAIREPEGDLVCRYGGEEFIVLIKNGSVAAQVAERIRTVIEAMKFDIGEGREIPVTVSIGVSPYNTNTEQMIEQADQALYKSKEGGRNRVTVFDELITK